MGFGTLWRASCAAYPGASWRDWAQRGKLIVAGARYWDGVAPLLSQEGAAPVNRILRERPEMLGVLVWPYVSAFWNPSKRLAGIAEHGAVLSALEAALDFSIDEHIELALLDDVYKGAYLIIDQPRWFMREGLLTINLMIGDLRAFSIAFSFIYDDENNPCAVIGGIQGRSTDGILSLYKALTKSLFGMRPRDFLLEALKIFLRSIEISQLIAVSDAARHHRHSYFDQTNSNFTLNYDDIWKDRGAVRLNVEFYKLSLLPERRDFATIKPNKRSQYRKRYEFLELLERRITERTTDLQPVASREFD